VASPVTPKILAIRQPAKNCRTRTIAEDRPPRTWTSARCSTSVQAWALDMVPARSPEAWLGDVPRFTHEGVGRSSSGGWDRPDLGHQEVTERQERRRSWRPTPIGCLFGDGECYALNLRRRGSVMVRASPTRAWDGVLPKRRVGRSCSPGRDRRRERCCFRRPVRSTGFCEFLAGYDRLEFGSK